MVCVITFIEMGQNLLFSKLITVTPGYQEAHFWSFDTPPWSCSPFPPSFIWFKEGQSNSHKPNRDYCQDLSAPKHYHFCSNSIVPGLLSMDPKWHHVQGASILWPSSCSPRCIEVLPMPGLHGSAHFHIIGQCSLCYSTMSGWLDGWFGEVSRPSQTLCWNRLSHKALGPYVDLESLAWTHLFLLGCSPYLSPRSSPASRPWSRPPCANRFS